jgi:hypothetical protein
MCPINCEYSWLHHDLWANHWLASTVHVTSIGAYFSALLKLLGFEMVTALGRGYLHDKTISRTNWLVLINRESVGGRPIRRKWKQDAIEQKVQLKQERAKADISVEFSVHQKYYSHTPLAS